MTSGKNCVAFVLISGFDPGLFRKVFFFFFLFPLWLSEQRICLQCGRPEFDPWVGEIPWRRERLPTPVFWPGEFHGLDSPCGRKELDRTERLSLSFSFKADLFI